MQNQWTARVGADSVAISSNARTSRAFIRQRNKQSVLKITMIVAMGGWLYALAWVGWQVMDWLMT